MKKLLSLLFVGFLSAGFLIGQPRPPAQPGPPPVAEPEKARLQDFLFSADLVMRHQRELDLTREQRDFIVNEAKTAHSELMALRWDLQSRLQELTAAVEEGKVDEEELLAQLDKVLDLERQVKRTQLQLAVRIRNTLTKEQLDQLQELKELRGIGQRRRGRANNPAPGVP